MKILFTADWHIKLGQKNVPKIWQRDRYTKLFQKLEEMQSDIDIMIIGGDIFDKMPTLEELELYFDFLKHVKVKTIIFDGNHEATKRGETFLTKLITVTKSINPLVTILNGPHTSDGIDYIPYTHIKTFKKEDYSSNILCTHVRGSIPPHVQPEIDLEKLSQWEVVLAGDLHAHSNSQLNILYPGSPVSTSFHRNTIKNGVIIFDTESMENVWVDLGLPQLIRKTIEDKSEAVKTEYDHTIYEIVGDIKSLATVDTKDDLIDKKITIKEAEATLDFKNKKTITEELTEYLFKVQNMQEGDIKEVVKIYHDNINEYELE